MGIGYTGKIVRKIVWLFLIGVVGAAGWFAQGDLRLFCPAPFDISYERLGKVTEAFRQLGLG